MVLLFPATGKPVSTMLESAVTNMLSVPPRLAGLLALVLITPLVLFLAHQVWWSGTVPPVALWLTSDWQRISGWLQSDFGQLNPLYPPHYLQMAKTSLRAVANNNWKVG